MHTPQFITFTGADDYTGIDDMQALSRDYPVEFGILFSPTRQGSGRYPSLSFVERLHSAKLSLAAHVCGGHSRGLITTGHIEPLQSLLTSGLFNRVQVNTADAKASPAAIRDWTQAFNLLPILQSRGEDRFPESRDVTWLFDRSGGRGTLATVWPVESDTQRLVGFAGGLGPDNVADAVRTIGRANHRYYIDMESRVRDSNDHFDIGICRAVCESVYGRRA